MFSAVLKIITEAWDNIFLLMFQSSLVSTSIVIAFVIIINKILAKKKENRTEKRNELIEEFLGSKYE